MRKKLLCKNWFDSKSERLRNLLAEDGQLNLYNEIELGGFEEERKGPHSTIPEQSKGSTAKNQTGSCAPRITGRRGHLLDNPAKEATAYNAVQSLYVSSLLRVSKIKCKRKIKYRISSSAELCHI
ncbi:hypothetical protein [Succiniclasticum ruminis]|uniref:hypothetical protein n=1 Tax=Succiniclasticum ruminis TaxID=40841 RepID=UPI00115FB3BF|nr:hypothetical protein [Succiniclasticum ruminis]